MSSIRYQAYPQTEPPPKWADALVAVFKNHEDRISTEALKKGLTSDQVLGELRADLVALGFDVEAGKRKDQKIARPVFFGENGEPTLRYEVDAFHDGWLCGLEVEAGRAWMGNAVYRDLIQALVMVNVETLALAVPNSYKYQTGGREVVSSDYANAKSLADTLYGHTRFTLPYRLFLIGY